ncbi:MAG: AAA family ATPase, partial [Dissulfuribacterales bacterium]
MNSENGSGNSHVITRIISLSIKNFRGFPGEHKIDTNADLVLLSGPNGYGKTSFMEALLLLLTGYRYAEKPELLINKNAKGFEIGAKIKLDGKDKGESSLSISYDLNSRVIVTRREARYPFENTAPPVVW